MNNFILPENYEHTYFENNDFPFGCYTMLGLTTLSHWHPHNEILYINKGSVDIYINGTLYACTEGDIQLIPINSLHSILPQENSIYTAIVIGDELFKNIDKDSHISTLICSLSERNYLSSYHLTNTSSYYHVLSQSIDTILTEFNSHNLMKELMIKLELCRFFTLLKRLVPDIRTSTEKDNISHTHTLKKSIEYLKVHYTEKITIKIMSHFMNISEQHFSRLFKAYTGKTFIEYLTEFRLEQAKKLIIYSDLPITQIPELTGFCNPNYFSRIYKRYYGISPSQTRKS